MKLQVGYDDFGKVRSKNLQFVDKTLFIKEIIDNEGVEVSVITRPRRFGKTFNLSTLHHFLAPEVNQIKTAGMFDGLKIAAVNNGSYMQHQGKYPVIFVSFKGTKDNTFQGALKGLRPVIQELYRIHRYLLDSDKLAQDEKELFKKFLSEEIDTSTIEISLRVLSELLYKHTGKKVFLLIDEYDTPIQSGYLSGYYNEIVNLMRGMFGAALKTNPYLDRAVVTGILRVAKESLFSGLNNVKVYSLLQSQYSQNFGFTEEEVHELLIQAKLEEYETEVRKWYNGYNFGGIIVYNPWSIVNYVNDGLLKPYWVNTSDNILIKEQLINSNVEFKEQFKLLLQGKSVEKSIDENMVFGDLKSNIGAAWSLLLMSGYLKAVTTTLDMGNIICKCAIPNFEVKILYNNIIKEWLGNGYGIEWYQNFLSYLLDGNIEKFTENFGQVLLRTISVYDVAHNPEAFYHGFMLGLAAGIDQNKYEIKSNRESGLGRYDIAIIPKDILKHAVILEIKSVYPPKVPEKNFHKVLDALLTRESKKALKQINKNQYTADLAHRGIANIIKIGLALSGKEFRLSSSN
ncbi:AAA-ATPase_like domain-containing protein [Gammaproteobacteria bacterium]